MLYHDVHNLFSNTLLFYKNKHSLSAFLREGAYTWSKACVREKVDLFAGKAYKRRNTVVQDSSFINTQKCLCIQVIVMLLN